MNPQEQFDRLYADHERSVRVIVARISRNPTDADDIISETWISAMKSLQNGHGPEAGKEKAWLGVVARNRANDFYASLEARREHEVLACDAFPEPADDEDDPMEAYGGEPGTMDRPDPRADEMRATLIGLTPAHRDVLVMRFISDLNYRQIAESLGITEASARKRVERGLAALRQNEGRHKQ